MPEGVLSILKYLFLALIYLFLARAVRAMYLEIANSDGSAPGPQTPRKKQARARSPQRLVVSADDKERVYNLAGSQEIIVGRAQHCHVVLEDTYSSQVHARLFEHDGQWFVEDLGSTNGTYLNRRRLVEPSPVEGGDKVRVGKTEMELKR